MPLKHNLFLVLFLVCASAAAQLKVVDAESTLPVPYATVQMQGQTGEQVSAADHNGELQLPQGFSGRLRITAVGYHALELPVDSVANNTLRLRPSTYALRQAVVTGQYSLRNDADAVQPVRVIGRAEMDRVGAVSLRDALVLQPIFNIIQDSQLGTNVQMLGLSGQHVQVMIDGVPVIGRLNGNIDFDQLPLDNVERIEIIEGPMSVEYGSEAIAGTINLITRRVGQRPGTNIRATTESIGRHQANIGTHIKLTETTGIDLRGSRLYFGGFNPEGRNSRELLWKPKEQYAANIAFSRRGARLTSTLSADYLNEVLWNDGPVQYTNQTRPVNDTTLGVYRVPFARDGRFITQRSIVRGDVSGEAFGGRIEGFLAFNHYRRERQSFIKDLEALNSEPLIAEGMNDTAVFVTYHSRSSYSRQAGERLHWSAGYDIQYEEGSGERISDGAQSITNAALFGSAEWRPMKNVIVRPGLRVIHNSVYEAPLVPSLHMKWSAGNHAVRASYGRGFRAPELKELYFLFVDFNHNIRGSETLQAEVSDSYQMGYTYSILRERSSLTATFSLFNNRVSELIDLALVDPETQLYEYINIGSVQTRGFTSGLNTVYGKLTSRMQLTVVEREARFDAAGDEKVTNTAIQGAFSADYRFHPTSTLSLQVNHRHNEVVSRLNEAGEVSQAGLSPLTLASLFLNRSFFDSKLSGTIGVDNVFNVTARTISGEIVSGGAHTQATGSQPVAMGRMWRFTLHYNLR